MKMLSLCYVRLSFLRQYIISVVKQVVFTLCFSNSDVFQYVYPYGDSRWSFLRHHVPSQVTCHKAKSQRSSHSRLDSRHCHSNPATVHVLLHGATMEGRSRNVLWREMANAYPRRQHVWLRNVCQENILDRSVRGLKLVPHGCYDSSVCYHCN